jgi:TonB family protein
VATATLPPDQKNKLDALLNRAERALAERQVDTAVALLRDAGTIQADNARLAYLTAQVLKERERALLARARSAAADGDFDRALSVLESAGSSTDVADTRRVVTQQQVDERVRNSLRLVQERLTRGALIEPTNDSARFHALSARSLAPRDAAVIRAVENVRTRVLNEARAAAQRGDSAIVDRLLSVAREDGAENSTLESIRSALRESRNNLRSAELTRLAGLVTQRISQNQLLEPEGDSAQHWFNQLRELENDGAVTANSRVNLNSRLLARGSEALGRGEYDATQRLLRGAEAVAGRTRESSALQEALSAQQEKDRLAKSVVGANSLKRTRFVEPVFPSAAVAQNIGGWVDLEFSVMPDGTVNRVQVLNANPAGVFDDAARIAVGKWRFEPVRRDGTAVEQRARLRMRFSPPD